MYNFHPINRASSDVYRVHSAAQLVLDTPASRSLRSQSLKAAFHYSIQLQTWFSTRFAARFSPSSCGFATHFRPEFDFFVENLVANGSRFAGSCVC